MKNLFSIVLLGGAALCANAQFQLPNSNFESWETVEYNSLSGEEPEGWNSFLTGTGSLKSIAGAVQLDRSSEAHSGEASARIWARAVFGSIIAQGNMTTGCINMAAMVASDATGNYNYTNYDVAGQNAGFIGYPDSMAVWVKAQVSKNAKISVVLHSEGYYQDPDVKTDGTELTGSNEITAQVVAKAERLDLQSTDCEWKRIVIPFVYNSKVTVRPEKMYALASFSTCSTPGEGTGYNAETGAGDVMLIDDVEMIYNSSLSSLSYNGIPLLKKDVYEYHLEDTDYDPSLLEYTVDGAGARAEVTYIDSESMLFINVYGDNFSDDNDNSHSYTIQFKDANTMELEGVLNISMLGGYVAENVPATIYITETGNNTCTFLLPNLVLGDLGTIGDIKLEGVNMTPDEAAGSISFAGSQQGMSLMGGAIIADVSLTGTVNKDKSANLLINVVWQNIPVEVTFTSDGNSGTGLIPSETGTGTVDVYSISGVKIMENVSRDEALRSLPRGFYIIGKEKMIIR